MSDNKHYKINLWKVLAVVVLLAVIDLLISNYTSYQSKIDWYDVWYSITNFIYDDSVPVETCMKTQCDDPKLPFWSKL
jgi:hypothetical protein